MINLYVLVVSCGILTLAVERIMRIFFEKRKTSLTITIFSYLLFWSALVSQYWVQPLVIYIYLFVAALIIVSLNYDSVMIKRLAAVAGSYVIIIACTFIFVILLTFIPNVEVTLFWATIITYFMVLLMFHKFKYIRKAKVTSARLWTPLLFIPVVDIISTTLMIIGINEFYRMITPIGTAFIFFYLYNNISKALDDNVKSALHTQEKEYYLTQCQLMQESAGRVRASRHEMRNHMAAIKEFIANDKADNATDYINNFLGDIGESNLLSETGNLALDSIINYKLKDIEKYGVEMNINLRVPPVVEIDDADIVIIIGNLLDNALEAVAKADEKTITLNVILDKDVLLIEVENPFRGEVKKGLTSLKSGAEHGHGLGNVRRSVDKYDGFLKISHDNGIFVVSIMLYEGV